MKYLKCCWTLLLLCAMPTVALAASLWEGTIGKAAVVVNYDPAHASDQGSYFYRRYLLDISLHARNESDAQDLLEGEDGPRWHMQTPGGDTWNGEWKGPDGRRLPIRLHALPASDQSTAGPDKQRERIGEAYDRQRVRDLKFKAGKKETRGDFQIQWQEEPRSGIRSLRVVAGYAEPVRQRINKILFDQQWRSVADAFICKSAPRGGDYEQTVSLRYIGADAISLSIFTAFDCGGAHPDFGDAPLTIDGRTGELLALEDVLYLGKGVPPKDKPDDNDAFYAYRRDVLAPWLAKTMRRLYPDKMPASQDTDACAYADPAVWESLSWHLTPAGIYIGPGFARVLRSCEYPAWSVLPWRVVRAHAGRVNAGPPRQ